ncbi:unnamed protein product [Discosporangium mesarthrocarpum]
MMDRLSNGQTFLPDGAGQPVALGVGGVGGAGTGDSRLEPPSRNTKEQKREALVDGNSHKVVWSALVLVEMVAGFLRFSAHFPAITTDILSRVSELLRLFNSRTTQLVLGAGAIHSSARLKSISAKHLALCSQSLGLVRALLPHARAALAARLSPKHQPLLVEMDRAAEDYRDHRDKILRKFVSMIEELLEARSAALKSTDWDDPSAKGSAGGRGAGGTEPCQFTADVRKGVMAMHNVLQQQLPPEQLQDVFHRIFTLLNRKVPECFERDGMPPSTAAGRQRILDDVGFMANALRTLRGVDATALHLEQAFEARYGSKPGVAGSVTSGDGESGGGEQESGA